VDAVFTALVVSGLVKVEGRRLVSVRRLPGEISCRLGPMFLRSVAAQGVRSGLFRNAGISHRGLRDVVYRFRRVR
jgi:hypothetical protein